MKCDLTLDVSETPNELVAKVKRGDREAFGRLYELLKTSVWTLAYQTLRDPTLTEEVVGDSFLTMIDRADRLPDDFPAVAAWVRTVAKRKCMDLFRRSKVHRNRVEMLVTHDSPLVTSVHNGQSPCKDAEDRLERIETIAEVAEAIERLPSDQQLAIQWRYYDDLSLTEIGQRLGITPSATNSLLYRARTKLRATLTSIRLDSHPATLSPPIEAHGTQTTPSNRSAK